MTNHFEMLNSFITSHVEMSEAELTAFNQKCEIVEFSKGAETSSLRQENIVTVINNR